MKKVAVIVVTTILSSFAFACPGGDLTNFDKDGVTWMVLDKSTRTITVAEWADLLRLDLANREFILSLCENEATCRGQKQFQIPSHFKFESIFAGLSKNRGAEKAMFMADGPVLTAVARGGCGSTVQGD